MVQLAAPPRPIVRPPSSRSTTMDPQDLPQKEPLMLKRRSYATFLIALACTSATLFEAPAYGQVPAPSPVKQDDLKNEVAAMKTENVAVRDQLRKLEEQQKALLALIESLRRRLDAIPVALVPQAAT